MAAPRDPDLEDRRPDPDRFDDDDDVLDPNDEELHAYDDLGVEGDVDPLNIDRWVDDDGELVDFDLDDLRGMDGPDA